MNNTYSKDKNCYIVGSRIVYAYSEEEAEQIETIRQFQEEVKQIEKIIEYKELDKKMEAANLRLLKNAYAYSEEEAEQIVRDENKEMEAAYLKKMEAAFHRIIKIVIKNNH